MYLTALFAGAAIAYAVHRFVVLEHEGPPEAPVAEVLGSSRREAAASETDSVTADAR